MKLIICITIAFTVFLSEPLIGAENNPIELTNQLKQMAKELQSNEHADVKSFIIKYISNKDLQKIQSKKDIDLVVEKFIKTKKENLRKLLTTSSEMTPIISEDKLTYTFNHKKNSTVTIKNSLSLIYSSKTNLFHIKN